MDLRSDIVAAAARMTTDYDVHREVRQLGAYLHDGETVQRLATGIYGAGAGLLAVTDRRVLLLRDGRSGHASEGFPLGRLSSADWVSDGGRATITVSDSSSTAVLRQVPLNDAQQVVELIHELAGQQRGYGGNGYSETPSYSGAQSYGPSAGDTQAPRGYGTTTFSDEATTALHAADATSALRVNGFGAHTTGASAVETESRRGIGGQPPYSSEATTALYANGTGQYAPNGSNGAGQYNAPGTHGTGQRNTHGTGLYNTPDINGTGQHNTHGTGLYNAPGTSGTGAHSVEGTSGTHGIDVSGPTTALRSPVNGTGSQPGWTGAHDTPRTSAGYFTTDSSGSGRFASGAVPVSVIASTTGIRAQHTDGRVPEQSSANELSGPIGAQPKLIGEVPITALASEEPVAPEVVPNGRYPAQAAVGIDQLATEGQPDLVGTETATLAVSSTAITEMPGSLRRTGSPSGATHAVEDGTETKPAIDPANLTAEGNERPKPISWRAPAGKKSLNPLSRPTKDGRGRKKSGPVRLDALGKPSSSPAGSGPGLQSRIRSKKFIWLGAGAVALVALAAVGSVKLMTNNSNIQAAAPVSPAPAAAVDSPVGTVVKITKIVAPDRIEVSDPAGSEVVVLGVAVPNANGCGYSISKAFANRTLSNQTVTMIQDPSQPVTDRQGRRQAYLKTSDGTDYSTEAVTQGMAKYYDSSRPVQKADELKTAQDAAKEKKAGLWDAPCNGKFATSGSESSGSGASATAASTKESTKPKSTTSSTSSKPSTKSAAPSSN